MFPIDLELEGRSSAVFIIELIAQNEKSVFFRDARGFSLLRDSPEMSFTAADRKNSLHLEDNNSANKSNVNASITQQEVFVDVHLIKSDTRHRSLRLSSIFAMVTVITLFGLVLWYAREHLPLRKKSWPPSKANMMFPPKFYDNSRKRQE